jgi:hypothetical protein
MAENVYDDSLLNDFDGVEDVDCDIDDLDKVVNEQKTEQAPQVEEVKVEEPTVPEVKEGSLDDLSLEALESLLVESNQEDVIEETTETEANKGDLNVALHQVRDKNKDLKTHNELLTQQLDLIKQQLELAKMGGQPQETAPIAVAPVDDIDFLSELNDSDVLTKEDMVKILNQQKAQQAQFTNEQQAQQSQEKGLELVNEFRASHNSKELGVLSFDNIDNLVKTGKVTLTNSQVYLIQNAVNEGLNPAELAYNMVIEKVPALKQKKFELDIREAIKKKGSANVDNVVNEPIVNNQDDELTMKSRNQDVSSHIDSLCDW